MGWSGGGEGVRKAKAIKASGASAPEVEGLQPLEGDRDRSRRRVWTVGIGVAVVLLLACVAIPAAVVGRWLVQGTIEAGLGAATPAVAVQDFFQDTPLGGALAGDEVEVNLLCDGREEQPHGRVVELVAAAKRAEVAGKVAFDRVEEHPSAGREQIADGRATYSTKAQWAYANIDPGRRPGSWMWWSSNFQPWSFELVDDDGWRLCGVNAPDPCAPNSGINCDPQTSVPSPTTAAGRVWDITVPYRCLPDRPYRDLEKGVRRLRRAGCSLVLTTALRINP